MRPILGHGDVGLLVHDHGLRDDHAAKVLVDARARRLLEALDVASQVLIRGLAIARDLPPTTHAPCGWCDLEATHVRVDGVARCIAASHQRTDHDPTVLPLTSCTNPLACVA